MVSTCGIKEPGPRMTLLGDWAENSSGDGVPNITRSEHVFRKAAWIILVICGVGGTFYQVYTIVKRYCEYPVSIKSNLTTQIPMEFPAVTICNTNIIRKTELYRAESELKDILLYSFGSNDTSHLSNSYERHMVRIEFDKAFAQLDKSTKLVVGHQKETFIIDCTFNEGHCGSEDFSSYINPRYGNCFTFNGDWGNIKTTHRAGPQHGLVLELFIQQDKYVPELTEEAGVVVTMHDPRIMPFPEDEGYLVPPHMLTMIGLRPIRIHRQKSPYPSNCWELNPREAIEYDAYAELYGKYYSYLGCQKTSYQEHVMSHCHCSDPLYPVDAQAVRKNLSDRDAIISPCQTKTEQLCESVVMAEFLEGTLMWNCHMNCNELQFVPQMSHGQWPSKDFREVYYNQLARRDPEFKPLVDAWTANRTGVADHIVKLKVYFEELSFDIITEAPAYPWTMLLSDLGGSFGFYLGISVIALFEFVELLIDLCIQGGIKCTGKDRKTITPVTVF